MLSFFLFDSSANELRIDDYSILLIKEFKELWEPSRNVCKEDPTGFKRIKAYKEFTYIYLLLDFKSAYFEYLERDKYESAKLDSGLTDEELEDEKFKAALDKYREIQNADRILSLIKTAHRLLYKTEVWLDNIDYEEMRDSDGKLTYKPADAIKDLKGIGQMRNELIALELEHKKGLAAQSKIRGDNVPGFRDE